MKLPGLDAELLRPVGQDWLRDLTGIIVSYPGPQFSHLRSEDFS